MKDSIQGYDNGKNYSLELARRERAEWQERMRFGNKEANPDL